MIISDTAIKHRTTVIVLMILIAVIGASSYVTLPREAAPDIQIPIIIVTTTYSGVAPEDIENLVTYEIEKKLKNLSDVDEITSTSTEGISTVAIKFLPNTDIDDALQKVRDKVDQAKPEMPSDIDEPAIAEINVSEFPIMLLNIHGPGGLVMLKEIAEDLQDDIEKIDGVLEAQITGDLTRQIRVEVDPYRLAAYRIPVSELFARIAAENKNVSGGTIDMPAAKYSARVEGEFADPREIYDLIVDPRGGKPLYLSDVAVVRDTFEDRLTYSRFDGTESITVAVVKRAGANIVRIADQVREIVRTYEERLPDAIRIDVSNDQSEFVDMMVADLENNMLSGLILVVIVLMVVMGVRNSVLVALAIPFSMMITFAALTALGITMNMIVLFSLILVVGMLVDNAIVIVENCYRHMQEGATRVRAAMKATSEVAWPVITSTLTTVAAFMPLLFWPDIIGDFMSYLPKTVIIALTASLFVAMVINPTLCAIFLRIKGNTAAGNTDTPMQSNPLGRAILNAYERILSVAIVPGVRGLIILVGFVLLVMAVMAFNALNGQVEFFPEGDPRVARINIELPVGTPLEVTNEVARGIEEKVLAYRYTDGADPWRNVKHVTTDVGKGGGDIFSGGGGIDSHLAVISIQFIDYTDRKVKSRNTIEKLREALGGMAGVQVQVVVEEEGPPTGKPIEIEVSGDEYDVLVPLCEKITGIVKSVPGVTDLDDDYDPGKPELRVVVERQRAALMNLSTGTIATSLKAAINGIEVSKYRDGNDDYDIVVRLPEQYRKRVSDIEALTIAGPGGQPVPLSAVGHIEYTSGLASIRRTDLRRAITITADVIKGYNSDQVLGEVMKALKGVTDTLPAGYFVAYRGEKEDMDKSQAFLLKAGIIALLVIAMILVSQFNSVLLPVIILLSVVLSWIGVFSGLAVTGKPFGVIMTGLGMISLAGIVVNNAIVLIDYINKLRDRGLEAVQAVIQAGRTRLRPVMLTAITTVLGLAPMALGWNVDIRGMSFNTDSESSLWWGPMAVAVIFGLAVSTLLTLVVVPAVYIMVDGVRQRWTTKHHDAARDA
ncbi:MAG: efflux RND transporter permease subunit [Planctomycetes bacterium]|nr:efflux RND transporter permease subunit [Planctomycetota bacterium]